MDSDRQQFIRLRSEGGEWLVPRELKARLVASAEAADTNQTDAALKILCKRYGVPHEPSSQRAKSRPDKRTLNLRLPADLDAALALSAAQRSPRLTVAQEIIAALCAHYGLRMPERRRASRARRRPARAAS